MLPYLMELLFNQYFLNIFGCLLLDYNLYLKVEYEHMDRFCPLIHKEEHLTIQYFFSLWQDSLREEALPKPEYG